MLKMEKDQKGALTDSSVENWHELQRTSYVMES